MNSCDNSNFCASVGCGNSRSCAKRPAHSHDNATTPLLVSTDRLGCCTAAGHAGAVMPSYHPAQGPRPPYLLLQACVGCSLYPQAQALVHVTLNQLCLDILTSLQHIQKHTHA
jgi:hypothetical protein